MHRHIYGKWVCRCCQTLKQAPAVAEVIDGGIAAGGLVATGVARMMGIGRFDGIAGSFIVTELSRQNVSFSNIFANMAVPGVIAAFALHIKPWAHPKSAASDTAPRASEVLGH